MNPLNNILADRTRAKKLGDPNADLCFLALADKSGNASVRTLVLRDIIDNRLTLFINKTSPKWRIISKGGTAQLLLWYSSVQRQYRLTGHIVELNRNTVEINWHRRPLVSKYLDHLYEHLGPQSSFVPTREILTDRLDGLRKSIKADSLKALPSATGVQIVCNSIEILDLSRVDQLHDRQLFTLDGDVWSSQIMIP